MADKKKVRKKAKAAWANYSNLAYLVLLVIFIGLFIFVLFLWRPVTLPVTIISCVSGVLPAFNVLISERPKTQKIYLVAFMFFIAASATGTLQKMLMPNEYDKYIYAGDRFRDIKQYALAISEYEKAQSANPQNTKILRNLSICYMNNNEIEKAINIQEQVVAILPSIEDRGLLASMYFKTAYEKYFKRNVIIDDVNTIDISRALEAQHISPTENEYTETIELENGKIVGTEAIKLPDEVDTILNKSEDICINILKENESHESSLTLLSMICFMRGSFSRTINYQNKLMKISPRLGTLFNLCASYLNVIRVPWYQKKEIIVEGKKETIFARKNFATHYLSGLNDTIMRLSKYEMKEEDKKRYISILFSAIDVYFDLFEMREFTKKIAEMKSYDCYYLANNIIFLTNKILEIERDNPIALFYAGQSSLLKCDYKSASTYFEKAMNSNESDKGFELLLNGFKAIADSLRTNGESISVDVEMEMWTSNGAKRIMFSDIMNKLKSKKYFVIFRIGNNGYKYIEETITISDEPLGEAFIQAGIRIKKRNK